MHNLPRLPQSPHVASGLGLVHAGFTEVFNFTSMKVYGIVIKGKQV